MLYQKMFGKRHPGFSWHLAALVTAGVGILDEFLQKFIPDRQGSMNDVLLNAFSGVLGLSLLACLDKNFKRSHLRGRL
jgi:VanZ family protein